MPWLALWVYLLMVAISVPMMAQTDHPVDIGRNNQLAFTDVASGTNQTVVAPGDTVTWSWRYVGIDHSTTSGTCSNGFCTPDGIWDSGLRINTGASVPPPFTRQFNNLGVFPYFCRIHGPIGMVGKVIVLNGPDYELDVTNSFFPPPPNPSLTAIAGQTVKFNSRLIGFLGYNNLVNLSCTGGSPRNPDNCPAQSSTPSPSGTSFNFSVGDSTPGTYSFNVTGVGTDAAHITHSQRVQLVVQDFNLTPLSPNVVTALPGKTSQPINFQVTSANGFNAFVNLSCMGLPPGTSCIFNPFFVNLFGPPVPVSLTVNNFGAPPGTFQVTVQGTVNIFSNGSFQTFVRSQTFTLKTGPTHFTLAGPSRVVAGSPFSVTATALDDDQQVVTGYTGTVHFTSSDGAATLPADLTFSATDNGVHAFINGVVLRSLGSSTVTVTDISTPVSGTWPIAVVPAEHLKLQVLPGTNVISGMPFSIVVTAVDAVGAAVPQYSDTIHFVISDLSASGALPPDYTFTGLGGDNGTHAFTPLMLNKIEPVTITVTDVNFPSLAAATPLILVGNNAFDGTMTLVSSRAGQAPPHFAVGTNAAENGSLSFTATVHLNSGDPAGNVRFFDGSTELGVRPLSPAIGGTATATYTLDGIGEQLRPGGHVIIAVYEPAAGVGTLAIIPQPRSPAPLCHAGRCP